MNKYDVLLWRDSPRPRPADVPADWPEIVNPVGESEPMRAAPWKRWTQAQLDAHVARYRSQVDAATAKRRDENKRAAAEARVEKEREEATLAVVVDKLNNARGKPLGLTSAELRWLLLWIVRSTADLTTRADRG